jgi:KaiC/GvpD/RAD55 family RecA-like ATPase
MRIKICKEGNLLKTTRPEDWQGKIAILVIPPEFYVYISTEIPVELVKEWGMEGIIVSANKPYMTMKEHLEQNGILNALTYLDCASKFAGANPQGENLVLLNNPANLIELDICIMKCFGNFSKRKFLLIDSLTTLLIYNKAEDLTRFAHRLGLMLKSNRITTFFLMVDQETTKEMLKFLSTIADKIVHLGVNKKGEVFCD